jgi:thioredoxin 1
MATFSEIINSNQPVLVDFFAEWCGPCKMLAPILKEISSEVDGKARILKVDIDKNPAVAAHYGVQAVPTLLLFKNGEIKWRHAGILPKYQLLEVISRYY